MKIPLELAACSSWKVKRLVVLGVSYVNLLAVKKVTIEEVTCAHSIAFLHSLVLDFIFLLTVSFLFHFAVCLYVQVHLRGRAMVSTVCV